MNKFSKWLVAIFTKIFDGFFEHVGDAIAVAIAVYFATLWGGRAANQEIKSVLENKQTDTVFVVNLHSDFAKAREYEIAGFQALADKDLDKAIKCFTDSENSANSFHSSFEISNYLKDMRPQQAKPGFWKEVYEYFLENRYGYMPEEVKNSMKAYLRETK